MGLWSVGVGGFHIQSTPGGRTMSRFLPCRQCKISRCETLGGPGSKSENNNKSMERF